MQGANLVSPAHEAAEVAGQLSLLRCDLAEVYVAGGAVERNNIALVYYRAIGKGQGLILFGNLDAVYACYTAVPMPRATTAACEVMPPRAVMMPSDTAMPSISSGEVS